MSVQNKTRAEDERLLVMLELQEQGWTSIEIGQHFGLPSSGVRTMINRVKKAMPAT